MAFEIVRPATAFSLGAPKGKRRPRKQDWDYLAALRKLPCVACGSHIRVEAAHIRTASRQFGKRETGISEKPSDQWALPLCDSCHRIGPDAQHSGSELAFYEALGINPFVTALALWAARDELDRMEVIIQEARCAKDL